MFDELLIHTVEVYRRTGRRDRFGQEVDVNPTFNENPIATYACRMTRGRGGLTMEERSVDVFSTKYTIFCAPDIDILEDDAVRVMDVDGTEILPRSQITNKKIAHDAVGPHHLELEILGQKGPQ